LPPERTCHSPQDDGRDSKSSNTLKNDNGHVPTIPIPSVPNFGHDDHSETVGYQDEEEWNGKKEACDYLETKCQLKSKEKEKENVNTYFIREFAKLDLDEHEDRRDDRDAIERNAQARASVKKTLAYFQIF
jgi:hypothetical protein